MNDEYGVRNKKLAKMQRLLKTIVRNKYYRFDCFAYNLTHEIPRERKIAFAKVRKTNCVYSALQIVAKIHQLCKIGVDDNYIERRNVKTSYAMLKRSRIICCVNHSRQKKSELVERDERQSRCQY